MARYAVFMAFLTLVAVVRSGDVGVTTVPLSVGGAPAQRPNPAVPAPPGAATALHTGVGAARTTSPLIVVAPVLETPAVEAIPKLAATPRSGAGPAGPGFPQPP